MNTSNFSNGYATSDSLGGLEYREIVSRMAEGGDKMSLSSVRGHFLSGLAKIAKEVCLTQGIPKANLEKEIKRIIVDPRFQESISTTMNEMSAGDI